MTLCAFSQNENTDLSTFQKGLLIESSNTLIPWNSRLSDTASISRPKINRISDKNIEADWNTAKILNGLKVPLKGYFRMVHGDWHLIHFYSFIDSSNLSAIKNHLDTHFRKSGILKGEKRQAFFYEWKLDNCMVRLGRFPKGERFEPYNDKYYMWIQKL